MTLPEDFINYTRSIMSGGLFDALMQGLRQAPTVSIRLNPGKCDTNKTVVSDARARVGWCENGIYLNHRPNFTFDPLMHAGLYYVQEAASQFICHVLRQVTTEPVTMLDLCAAPGGKSSACRSVLPEGSLLVCNEPTRTRANILSENMQKQGYADIIVTNNYPKEFQAGGVTFDIVLADVPCSGEGMFRKDEGAVNEWSLQNVENCQRLQREIITDIWPCLRPGGILIYSTCTFNTRENEENAAWIASALGAEFMDIDIKEEWRITPALSGDNPAYRFLPGISDGEGLFMTVLRKTSDATIKTKKNRPAKQQGKRAKTEHIPLVHPTDFDTREYGGKLSAIPKRWADVFDLVSKRLNILHAGITIGTFKGKDLIPDQSLALSTQIERSAFNIRDLDAAQAINYLRKETITLPPETPRGIILLTHRGLPIGFAKNIGNRANNLYPQEWKIKSSHIPNDNNIIISKYEAIS